MNTLDEAAEKYAYEEYPSVGVGNTELEKAFKAGALWMAKQHANEISECIEKDAQQRLDDSGYNIE